MERYGVYVVNHPDSTAKRKLTVYNKYGVLYVTQDREVKGKLSKSVKKALSDPSVRQKMADACSANEDRRNATMQERYGTIDAMQVPGAKGRYRATCMANFGYAHPSHSPVLLRKRFMSLIRRKDCMLPSGRIVHLQGYEPWALEILMGLYTESEFSWDDLPAIPYVHDAKNKFYHPDFFLPEQRLVVEVKSWYTLLCEDTMNAAKQAACLAQGYRFEFWVGADKDPGHHPFTVITIPLADYLRERAEAIAKSTV
jgi:hypothetical protein